MDHLSKHLIVEYEIVRILFKRQAVEHRSAESTKTGVVFRQLIAEQDILNERQKAVRYVFIKRHAASKSSAAKYSRCNNSVVLAISDHSDHRNDQMRRILVIGMDHNHDVGT